MSKNAWEYGLDEMFPFFANETHYVQYFIVHSVYCVFGYTYYRIQLNFICWHFTYIRRMLLFKTHDNDLCE